MWRELFEAASRPGDWFILNDPAPVGAIQNLESALGLSLPAELRTLLEESNGIGRSDSNSEFHEYQMWHIPVEPVETILEININRGMGGEHLLAIPQTLLAFQGLGNGDQLAIQTAGPSYGAIYRLNHEDASIEPVPCSLRQVLLGTPPEPT